MQRLAWRLTQGPRELSHFAERQEPRDRRDQGGPVALRTGRGAARTSLVEAPPPGRVDRTSLQQPRHDIY